MNNNDGLYERLIKHNNNDIYPMHMPGHKRNRDIMDMVNPYSIDITEIDDFDNMHNPTGIIKKIEEEASELYGAEKTWLSVNGSSIGIMASICAVTKKGDSILIGRNSHKSVYNAIELNELNPQYIYPENLGNGINGQVFLTDIVKKIESDNKIKVVVVTSPTYEGIISDIRSISEYLHSKGIPLIIDAAHGAHFGFNKDFPHNALHDKADIVIHSIHKTLPAFTQTSLLHISSDSYVDVKKINKYMSIFQSSSPSYVLMSGIEKCIKVVRNGKELFEKYNNYLEEFYQKVKILKNIYVLDYKKDGKIWRDKSKIVIISKAKDVRNYGGVYIYNKFLTKYNIQLEMKSGRFALAMTSICDTKEGMDRLLIALVNIDRELEENNVEIVDNSVDNVDNSNVEKCSNYADWDDLPIASESYALYPPKKAQELLITPFKLEESVDKICGEYVYLYPPGIPLIVPGEIITQSFIDIIREYRRRGLLVEGLEDRKAEFINIVEETHGKNLCFNGKKCNR